MKKFGNIYVIAATAVIGGALFGFDISSMSAIISTQPYKCQFNRWVSALRYSLLPLSIPSSPVLSNNFISVMRCHGDMWCK